MDKAYIDLVRLLLESAPAIFATRDFAMKGGTAINLFIEAMPRLSVDIDVVYSHYEASRELTHHGPWFVRFARSVDASGRKSDADLRCPQRRNPPDKRPVKLFRPQDYSAAGNRFLEASSYTSKLKLPQRFKAFGGRSQQLTL